MSSDGELPASSALRRAECCPADDVRFRMWAPAENAVSLSRPRRLTAARVTMAAERAPAGSRAHRSIAPAAGALYRYASGDRLAGADPASRYQPAERARASQGSIPPPYLWRNDGLVRRAWEKKPLLEEAKSRAVSPAGGFERHAGRLDHLVRSAHSARAHAARQISTAAQLGL